MSPYLKKLEFTARCEPPTGLGTVGKEVHMNPKYAPLSRVEAERRESLFLWLRTRPAGEDTGAQFDSDDWHDLDYAYRHDPLGVTRGILWTAGGAIAFWALLFWVLNL
jgi:hypothetical protein